MSLPRILRRLFENEGAGPRLLKAILPFHADTHGAKGSDPITPESIGAMAANAKPGSASSADVAVKLKTSRAIDGMGFDGTKSIIHYAVCSTAAATAAKTVNLTGFVLEIGARILVRFDTTNTAVNPTLNVNGTGAKAIRYKNATVTASVLAAKSIREFVYDGAYWQIVGDLDSNTTYTAASADPLAPGTAAVGTSVKYAREDHRHPVQTSVSGSSGSCTGNAATATELATSRAIDGVNFDGSAAITHYAECSTAAATAAKAVSLTGFTLVKGAKVTVRFTVTNTAANPTLNVNKTGAKAIQYRNAAITAGALAANRTYEFVYDGSSWELVGDLDTNTTYNVFTKATASAAGKAGLVPAPGAGKQEDFLRGDGTWQAVVGLVPVGGIVAFSGTFSGRNPVDMKSKKAMTGWCLCDGTKTNNLAVPDLRDRMIMGAGTTYQTGSKGGAATHTHGVSGTVGGTTTTVAQTAKHYHEQGTQVVNDARVPSWGRRGSKDTYRTGWKTSIDAAVGWSGSVSDAGSSASHTHSLTGAKSNSASSLPPYYALAYIMRVA